MTHKDHEKRYIIGLFIFGGRGGTIFQTLKNVLVNLIYMAMGLYYAIRLLMEYCPP
jgi:hypothetical protein